MFEGFRKWWNTSALEGYQPLPSQTRFAPSKSEYTELEKVLIESAKEPGRWIWEAPVISYIGYSRYKDVNTGVIADLYSSRMGCYARVDGVRVCDEFAKELNNTIRTMRELIKEKEEREALDNLTVKYLGGNTNE